MDNYFKLNLLEIKDRIKHLEGELGYIPKPEIAYATQLYLGCGNGGCKGSCADGCSGALYDSCLFNT